MSQLPFEAFLALRYLKPKRTFVSVITLISIIGVTLGVAVLIIVISVMSGFDREWQSKIVGFNSHLKLYGPSNGPLRDFPKVIDQIRTNQLVTGAAPFLAGQVLLRTEPADGHSLSYAPILSGIDPEAERAVNNLHTNVIIGKFDLSGDSMLMGAELADMLKVRVGDRIVVYSPAKLEEMVNETNSVRHVGEEFKITGIFDVGFSEFNSGIVITSIERAQEIYDYPEDAAQGVQIALHNLYQADAARDQLSAQLGHRYNMITWREERPQLFNALATEKNMMFYLLFFIMIVAAFGIANCQITFVVQKTREIGILKALGATNPQVLWIFLSQSVAVGFLGVGLGFSLAMLALHYRNEFLHFMNRATGFELLPASIYQIYELPASIEVQDVTIICVTAFLTCVAAGLFPAWKAARQQPVEALRHE
jgi:lipoprotein-releasing system permease protein